MLSFHDPARLGRRAFLRAGALSLGGLTLADRSSARGSPPAPPADKSVVFLFLHGGPSQIETFDPHMEAPAETRSATGEIRTALPGVTFGSSFPRLARLADRLAVVRSFVPGDANHDIKPVVGKESAGANLGAAYAQVVGANHPETGLPRNVVLFPRAVDPSCQPGTTSFGNFGATGPFGPATAPFQPGAGGSLREDMRLALPADRFDDRRALLAEFDRARAAFDATQRDGVDESRRKAVSLLLGGAADAFDLAREDPRTIDRYDTAPLVRPENIDRKWKNYNNYVDNAKALGKLMLLARRLCERGAGFVTVTTNFVWDMHADVNNAPVAEGMRYMGPPLDHAVAAFLEDVAARGLSDRILLVCCGEMGRTPKVNKNGGRDHWGNLGPLLLAGGGLNVGQVIGRSARTGGEPNSDPVSVRHLIGTVMHTLFDVGQLRVARGVPRDVLRMAEWDPIPGLHG
jgi:acetyl esterase/lipase